MTLSALMPLLAILNKCVLILLLILSIISIKIILTKRSLFKNHYAPSKWKAEVEKILLKPQQNIRTLPYQLRVFFNQHQQILTEDLSTLATLGSNAPFIGLFGTVLGIIQAFGALSSAQNDVNKVMSTVAEALIATAVGLFVAIPALWAYNHYQQKIKKTFSLADQLVDQFKNEQASQNES
jgi:biopolymer transport protein ExbB/TolQ